LSGFGRINNACQNESAIRVLDQYIEPAPRRICS
jgi:hypothetical protein